MIVSYMFNNFLINFFYLFCDEMMMIIFVRECFIMEEKVSFFREIDFTKISSEFRKFKKTIYDHHSNL